MDEKDIERFKRYYTKHATEDLKNKLGINKISDFAKGLICGGKLAYEMILLAVMPYNDFVVFKDNLKTTLSNELNITYSEVEELLN